MVVWNCMQTSQNCFNSLTLRYFCSNTPQSGIQRDAALNQNSAYVIAKTSRVLPKALAPLMSNIFPVLPRVSGIIFLLFAAYYVTCLFSNLHIMFGCSICRTLRYKFPKWALSWAYSFNRFTIANTYWPRHCLPACVLVLHSYETVLPDSLLFNN